MVAGRPVLPGLVDSIIDSCMLHTQHAVVPSRTLQSGGVDTLLGKILVGKAILKLTGWWIQYQESALVLNHSPQYDLSASTIDSQHQDGIPLVLFQTTRNFGLVGRHVCKATNEDSEQNTSWQRDTVVRFTRIQYLHAKHPLCRTREVGKVALPLKFN